MSLTRSIAANCEIIGALALGAAAGIFEFGARAQQAIVQVGLLRRKLVAFGRYGRKLAFQGSAGLLSSGDISEVRFRLLPTQL